MPSSTGSTLRPRRARASFQCSCSSTRPGTPRTEWNFPGCTIPGSRGPPRPPCPSTRAPRGKVGSYPGRRIGCSIHPGIPSTRWRPRSRRSQRRRRRGQRRCCCRSTQQSTACKTATPGRGRSSRERTPRSSTRNYPRSSRGMSPRGMLRVRRSRPCSSTLGCRGYTRACRSGWARCTNQPGKTGSIRRRCRRRRLKPATGESKGAVRRERRACFREVAHW